MSDKKNPSSDPWGFLTKVTVAWNIGTIIVSLISGIGGAYLYIRTLVNEIYRLDAQVASLEQKISANTSQIAANSSTADSLTKALSFGENFAPHSVSFNGTRAETLCPAGQVMRGIRIAGLPWTNGNPSGEIDCVGIVLPQK